MSVARRYQRSYSVTPNVLTHALDWRSLAYSSCSGRDLRLDLLRGFCVFAMVVDHIGGRSWLSTITGNNHFFVSAAEGFVFISGLVLGMVSVKRVLRGGLTGAVRAVLQRALKLYALTVALTLGLALWEGGVGLSEGWSLRDPEFPRLALSVLTLHRTYYLIDVLQLYTLLMLAAPLALLLLARRRSMLLLVGSWLLWFAYQLHPDQVAVPWPMDGGDAFPFAAWQVLFYTGLVLGYHREDVARRLRHLPKTPLLAGLAVLYVALVAFDRSGGEWLAPLVKGDVVDFMTRTFDKTSVAPGRLVAFAVVFPLAYLLVTAFWQPLRAAAGTFLLTLGQNALLAYSLQVGMIGVFLSGEMDRMGRNPDVTPINTLFQMAALGLIWLLVQQRTILSSVFSHAAPRLATIGRR